MGELHFWSSAASGWASRSFFVRFSYAFRALLKISWKLDDDPEGAAVMKLELDIRAAGLRSFDLARVERMMDVR